MAIHWLGTGYRRMHPKRNRLLYVGAGDGEWPALQMYRITEKFGSLSDHMHDYLQIWYVSKGEFIHTLYGQKYRMVQGNIFVLPPYSVHRVEMVPGKNWRCWGANSCRPSLTNDWRECRLSRNCSTFLYQAFVTTEDRVPPQNHLDWRQLTSP